MLDLILIGLAYVELLHSFPQANGAYLQRATQSKATLRRITAQLA